jgi:hypothetical protein
MYISHHTTKTHLQCIVDAGTIKPSSVCKRVQMNPSNTYLPYTFYNVMPMHTLKHKFNVTDYCIIFKSSVLENIVFYTNRYHSKGDTKSSVKYPKKYYETHNIDNVLYEMYKLSVMDVQTRKNAYNPVKDYPYYTVYQELFIKGSLSLNDASYITLPLSMKNSVLTKQINSKYPNITIIFKNRKWV